MIEFSVCNGVVPPKILAALRESFVGLQIKFGNRTKCHRCKRVDEYLTELV